MTTTSSDPTAPPASAARFARGATALSAGWAVVMAIATAVLVAARAGWSPPAHTEALAAAVVTGGLAAALGHRTGDRPLVGGALGLALGVAAATTDLRVLDAGVALGTAVLAGVLAVMITTPAASFPRTVREVLLATLVGAVGALAVAGYAPEVSALRFRYVAVVVALVLVVGLVSGLGAGLHGAGRRGAIALVVGTLILVAAVAYGEALSRWGAPALIDVIAGLRRTLRAHLGAVPHPIETLLGYPALTWGVFMRARRRQGWWVTAFGVAATASTACALIDPGIGLLRAVLGCAYSLVLGVLIGYVIIRLDLYWTGPRGSRARRDEEAHALRPEPGRTRPLR